MINVLIIEDEHAIRRFLRTALEADGMRVFEAETLQRGLIEAATRKPDLAILDLGLPDGDGIDFIRDLRQWSQMPILVLSARTEETDKIAALDAGAAAARRTGCVISRREIGRPEEDTQRLIGGFQPPPPAPMPPADPASSEALLTLLASVRQGMTAGEVAAHFAWPLDKARQALEQLFSAGTLRKRSSRYRLKNP